MNVRRALALTAIVALGLTACGDDDDPVADGSTAPSASADTATSAGTAGPRTTAAAATTTEAATTTTVDLATALGGRTFLSTSVEGYQLVDGTEIQLTFDGANISAAGGCNQLASTWSLEGDVLVVPGMAMTQMACEPAALMDQDTWLSAVLTSRPTVTLDGDDLTLTADGTVVTFVDREVANPDLPLEGTTWNVEGLVSNDAVSSIPAGGRVPTLRFEGGTVAVDTGCNTGSGAYTTSGTDVTFGPIALTRMACLGDDIAQTEQAILDGPHRHGGLGDRRRRPPTDQRSQRARAAGRPRGRHGARGPGGRALAARLDRGRQRDDRRRAPACGGRRSSSTARTSPSTRAATPVPATYTVAGDQITFGPLAMTLMLCQGITNDVEQAQLAVLTGTATVTIADGVLTLMNGDQGLHYTTG